MRSVLGTLGQVLILLVLALAVGFGANAARPSRHVILSRPYAFAKEVPPPPTSTVSGPETTARPGPDPGQSTSAPTSEFAELTLAQVLEICADPNTQVGLNMFLDARKAEDFEAGHIPGARLCSYNDIQTYLPNVEPWLAMANRIVVYCIGPDCEDSHDLCRALTMFYNVPKEKLLLFKGGWQEWTANNLQAATGPE